MIRAGDLAIDAGGLDPAAVARILAARQAAAAAAPDAAVRATVPHLLFLIGTARHTLELTDIAEIAAIPRITPVPGAPPALLGVVARRGRVVNLFDGAALLRLPPVPPTQMIMLRHEAPRLALAVSDTIGVIAVDAAEAIGDGAPPRFIAGDVMAQAIPAGLLIERMVARGAQKEG